jgi:hypothetical protein
VRLLRLVLSLLQNIDTENLEEYVGYELPAKFMEVDEVRHRPRAATVTHQWQDLY